MSRQQPSKPVEDSPIELDYTCTHCEREFRSETAYMVEIIEDGDEEVAEIMCPWCHNTDEYPSPEDVPRPPSVDRTEIVEEDDCTIAKLFFASESWLQFRQTPDGRVKEEMFNADGDEIESFPSEIEYDGADIDEIYDDPQDYLNRDIERFEKYTIRGLRIQKPHVYAVLIKGH